MLPWKLLGPPARPLFRLRVARKHPFVSAGRVHEKFQTLRPPSRIAIATIIGLLLATLLVPVTEVAPWPAARRLDCSVSLLVDREPSRGALRRRRLASMFIFSSFRHETVSDFSRHFSIGGVARPCSSGLVRGFVPTVETYSR